MGTLTLAFQNKMQKDLGTLVGALHADFGPRGPQFREVSDYRNRPQLPPGPQKSIPGNYQNVPIIIAIH